MIKNKKEEVYKKAKEAFLVLQKRIQKGYSIPQKIVVVGEEPFYIEMIDQLFSKQFLPENIRAENRTILRGEEIDVENLISSLIEIPWGDEPTLLIVRNAEKIKDESRVLDYLDQMDLNRTLLMLYNVEDKIAPSILDRFKDKKGVELIFSEKVKNLNSFKSALSFCAKQLNVSVANDAKYLLFDLLGNDLMTLYSEMSKLSLLVNNLPNREIPKKYVEYCVVRVKNYTIFDLLNAIIERQKVRTKEIALYIAGDEKNFPLKMILNVFFNFFCNLFILFYKKPFQTLEDQSKYLGLKSKYESERYESAKSVFTASAVYKIIAEIRRVDACSVGAQEGLYTSRGLLLDLITFIELNAEGYELKK